MKKLLLLSALFYSLTGVADSFVQGHYRDDGTYVQPHMRSDPNSTTLDNWSTRGNVNPYTGEMGTKDPYDISPNVREDPQLEEYENDYYGDFLETE